MQHTIHHRVLWCILFGEQDIDLHGIHGWKFVRYVR